MNSEYQLPLTSSTYLFIGKKPVAVLFGAEKITVNTWRGVYEVIIKRCNQDAGNHERLMEMRGRIHGNCRVLLAKSPDGMSNPLKIDENLFGETHYGSATLMHILINRILVYTGFSYHNIIIVLKEGRK